MFDLASYIKTHPEKFMPGETIKLTLSLQNFNRSSDKASEDDFKLTYAFSFSYYDKRPDTVSNPNFDFSVKPLFHPLSLGLPSSLGHTFTYNLTLTNIQTHKGLGMTLAIIRVPSCLEIQYDYLEKLKSNHIVDYYEVRND